MKKNKSVNGGILLEVLFMLSIMIGIFPIIQRNTKKRTDEIRNKMVVNDLLKIKDAVENYLKQDIEVNNPGNFLGNVRIQELYDMGLPKTFVVGDSDFFTKENVLGQEYEVKLKKQVIGNDVSYSAIIIAKDPSKSIPVMRIRDIIKETKGYAGYLEKEEGESGGINYMIYGQNWQLNGNDWGLAGDGDPYKNAIFLRAGTSKKEYEYISRKSGAGRNNVMRTDLQMNNQNINAIKDLYIEESLDVGLLNLKSSTVAPSEFERISISGYEADDPDNPGAVAIVNPDGDGYGGAGAGALGHASTEDIGKASFTIAGSMVINGALKFPLGLLMNTLSFSDDKTKYVKLQQRLKTNNLRLGTTDTCNFSDSYNNNCNRAQKIIAKELKGNTTIEFAIANLLKTNNAFNASNLLTSSFDSVAPAGLNVTSITTENNICSDCTGEVKGKINSSKINLNDIILRNVNEKFASNSSEVTLVGGIAIGPRTPLSAVFRALYYEYADTYKAIKNQYPAHLNNLKWCYKRTRRYEQPDNDLSTGWWSDNCNDNN